MSNLVQWARGGRSAARSGPNPWPSITLDQLPYWFGQFGYQGLGYGPAMIQTIQQNRETIAADFMGFINGAYKTNGAIFACMLCRMFLFSEARMQFRRLNNGRPGTLFGTKALDILEHPWPNATTGDLLTKAIVDVDLAGNFYSTRVPRLDRKGSKIARLRPDWVTIIKGTADDPNLNSAWDPTAELVGYIYTPGGPGSGLEPKLYLPEEVCHMAPIPDPAASYRGMSWVQPILTEILGDRAMSTHKVMYFENGAGGLASTPLATPTGWTTMGEIKVGDYVIGQNGKPTKVLGVYPRGEKNVYRLTFTGGVSTLCDEDHLWQVQTYGQRTGGGNDRYLKGHQVRSVQSLLEEGVRYPSGPHKFTIPLTDPVEYDDPGPLPLDPYLVGALLGDGHMGNSISLAAHADDAGWMADEVWSRLPVVAKVRLDIRQRDRQGTLSSEIKFVRRPRTAQGNWMAEQLKELGLRGLRGPDKAVPEPYMRASIEDRTSLLQGLVDTDGHVEEGQRGTIRFTNTSERLARQLVELVESLGGVASIKRCVRKGENNRVQWVVSFSRLPEEVVPVRLPRKRERYRLSSRFIDRTRFLKSIEPVGRDQTICIKVEAPDGLYLTDDFIVTHNTPNLVVSMEGIKDRQVFQEWIDLFENEHSGALNAFKTLYLGQGATATVVGANIKDLDYGAVQGQTELRICSAAGIPPMIIGFDRGLDASTLANFGQARRLLADRTMRPMWRNFCGSMETLVEPPPGSQLWYDDRDVPFLQDDESDTAEVQLTQSTAMRLLVDAGFDPDSIVDAITSNDMTKLTHSGMYSVQLHPPGQNGGPPPPGPSASSGKATGAGGGNVGLASADRRTQLLAGVGSVQELAQALLTAKSN